MRSVVFECRKCGHNLYFETKEDAVSKMVKISNLDCPRCGEEPDGNWILVGVCENPYYPVKEKE